MLGEVVDATDVNRKLRSDLTRKGQVIHLRSWLTIIVGVDENVGRARSNKAQRILAVIWVRIGRIRNRDVELFEVAIFVQISQNADVTVVNAVPTAEYCPSTPHCVPSEPYTGAKVTPI